jgi:hypothetical protein
MGRNGTLEESAGQVSRLRQQFRTFMKSIRQLCAAALLGSLLFASPSLRADDAKSYQVTGPVLELTPTKITVQKGNDRWEITRTPTTKVDGDLQVGAKVTIHYTMVADDVTVKADKKK